MTAAPTGKEVQGSRIAASPAGGDRRDQPDRSARVALPATHDIVSGLINSVFIIVLTVSYAVLIFSGSLAALLPVGIGYGLIAATVTAVVFAMASGIPFATAGPDSKPVAVLAALAAGIAADPSFVNGADTLGPTVLLGLIIATVLTGIVLYLLGALRTAGWIRFVPYPVMGGFLAASGWLLMTGSIQVMTGTRVSFATLGSIVGQAYVWQFAVGILFLMAIVLLRRIRHPLAFPVFLVVATLAVHGVLYATGTSLAAAREAHWLIDINAGVKVPDLWFSGAIARVEPWPILGAAANYGALIVVTASTVLLNTMGAEVETRIDADLDRELRITGLSNLLSGALGGMIGTLSLSRTLFCYRAGARRRIGGFVTGAVCFLTLGFGTEALGYIPVPLVGALLMQLGAAVLYEWLVEGRRRMPPLEYALLIAILLVIVLWDFVAGMAVGIIAALAREMGGEAQFHRLKAYMKLARFQPGELLCAQGDAADALYIINTGRVTVLFTTPENKEIRLRSMLRHTVVGEMGSYRSAKRGASIRIDEPTMVYVLSRNDMKQMIRDDPALAHAIHTFIICTLASRLDFANREVASLQMT
jgi:SulP family sulfate permease